MVKKISRFKFLVHNHTFFKTIIRRFLKKKTFKSEEDEQNYLAKFVFNYKFNCKEPRSFNEYLVWIKLNYRNDLWKMCADKLGSKDYIKSIGLSKYSPETYGIYKNSSEINLDLLPEEFVLKTNHDCGSVFICNKKSTDFKTIFKKLDASLKKNYSTFHKEWVYESVEPRIFAEELLKPSKQYNELIDFKFQTIGGKFVFGYALSNKQKDEIYSVFDRNFSIQNVWYQSIGPSKRHMLQKPACFDEMLSLAEKISKNFLEVRVDMFVTTKGIKIGEMTFFTQSGFGPFTSKKFDFRYGEYFKNIFKDGN